MYAVTGAFGQTGLALSQALLEAGHAIRMIVRRDDDQAADWRRKGAEVVVADLRSTVQMTKALRDVEAAYLMNPPAYFAPDLFEQARTTHSTLIEAANAARVPHIVALSSVGAQHASGTGNILTTHDFEMQLELYRGTAAILRAANFMENWAWSMEPVKEKRILPSMFRPIGKALPMISVKDIGICAAKLLTERSSQRRIVELKGPKDYSPVDAAQALSQILGHSIEPLEDKDEDWSATMLGIGFPQVTVKAFIEMFAGFNSGLIAFEGKYETLHGKTDLHTALSALV
jgi:uncharacterized protein YbjT (DUF2867 family)